MEGLNLIQKLAIFALPLIFAITVHEAAHGWLAMKLGDKTAYMLGRVTINPIKHIDPVGTVLVPLVLIYFTGFAFGWAKPVPVDWRNLHRPKRDMGLVALAGPASNLLMALIWAVMVLFGAAILPGFDWLGLPLVLMGVAGVLINCLLMALNLLPILPLDGGRILYSLLPHKQAQIYSRTEPFGLIVVVLLMMTDVLGDILWPVIRFTVALLPASNIVSEFIL
ncbi:MAG: site-2 protease family protein [Candidatus Thiodiazotropha sp.]